MHARVGQYHLIDQNLRIGPHGTDDVLEYRLRFVVGPVVQDGAEIVVFRILDGLRREEIMRHHLNTLHHRWRRFDRFLQILADDPARQIRVFGLQPPTLMPDVAANVDEVGAVGGAGVVGEGDDVEPFAVAGDGHEVLEPG